MKKKFDYKKLKTVAACFKARGLDYKQLNKAVPTNKFISKKHNNQLRADYVRTIVTEALNMDESGKVCEPNWLDSNEPKYRFYGVVKADKKHPSGLGFSRTDCGNWYANATVCSRHYFQNYDRFDHARTYFLKVFQNNLFS